MVDKGFGGRKYQKTTLASNPKGDYKKYASVGRFTIFGTCVFKSNLEHF
jgi:hypothetical protein